MSIVRIGFLGCVAAFVACTGDDVTLGPDSGPPKSDATIDTSPPMFDASVDASSRLLMTYKTTQGELAAFNTGRGMVDGRLTVPDFLYVEKSGADFFLLRTASDLVVKLDPTSQWQPVSSWSVALDDMGDAGVNADPVQVVEVAPNKAYVLRYNKNKIAIIDPSQSADAGAPTGSIDLGSQLQGADPDGAIEMSGAVYDPSTKRLYVALANIDIFNVDPQGYFLLCTPGLVSTLIAIDTTTDTLVNLGDAGPNGGVALNGVSAQQGLLGGVVLDPVGHRVLVMSTGCNQPSTDAGPGAMTGRLIEAVDLTTFTTKTLLDANAQPFPGVFTYIDGAHALVQFGFAPFATTYQWIPTETTLGPALPATPDLFDYDGVGQRILGPQQVYASDGGLGPMNVIAVPISGDAGATVLGQNPFLQTSGYEGNVVYVP